MSSQIRSNQSFVLAFTLFFSLFCMPVFAQNNAPASSTDSTNNFNSIANFFVTYIWPVILNIAKSLFSS
ncbi:hypothetical protein CONCODRAFT_9645 [Conidiobolus coronatus NRRL 28638]|uniref:Uncharacterized protein n=1 Tax=Conidiobolus coronatus (strain ATCC 28846 / CBS 209.66 / NRRL 28638) TaxID=796925 RepID=A0A137NZA9_CONC2|nr:hypothetical protein CONCODRAFT_9645 [Conidiobolus coronatus NRRL 28638]|eukprot:KXN68170.1 hypothetical protein CONCODRAFT_9645 [Conidiobolus coronatus NRRL 28638]